MIIKITKDYALGSSPDPDFEKLMMHDTVFSIAAEIWKKLTFKKTPSPTSPASHNRLETSTFIKDPKTIEKVLFLLKATRDDLAQISIRQQEVRESFIQNEMKLTRAINILESEDYGH